MASDGANVLFFGVKHHGWCFKRNNDWLLFFMNNKWIMQVGIFLGFLRRGKTGGC
jgi:hypothetical protein